MGEVIPFDRARRAHKQATSAQRLRVRVQRANKFRIEMPVVLEQLNSDITHMSTAIGHYLDDFCEDKGAGDLRDQLRLVFVGGLDAARARDQAWFTDFISPGMILLCWEADTPGL